MKLKTVEQVQKRVGKLPAPRDLKVIDYIDEHADRWLSHANFAFLAIGKPGDLKLTVAGGETGFVNVPDSGQLSLPMSSIDDDALLKEGLSFGALFLVSGMEETLRVNGTVGLTEEGAVTLNVEECYLHCAKAFKRSGFWEADSIQESLSEVDEFVSHSTFLALATINAIGQADVSPKGDPEKFLLQEADGNICFADRPGNRRIDSFRNIIEQPSVIILALVPGSKSLLEISGTAELSTDEKLLKKFAVQGKEPKLITKITPQSVEIRESEAIRRAGLWPAKDKPKDLNPAEIFKTHMKNSKDKSIQAKVARAAVSVPGAMKTGLEVDYKKNMY